MVVYELVACKVALTDLAALPVAAAEKDVFKVAHPVDRSSDVGLASCSEGAFVEVGSRLGFLVMGGESWASVRGESKVRKMTFEVQRSL